MIIQSQSTVYVHVPVSANLNGAAYDPTGDVVSFAFLPPTTEPTSSTTWALGSWDAGGPPYTARVLVGPANGGNVLGKGTWNVWVKVTDSPEVPIQNAGPIQIT